jgi:hypothetical protein
MSINWYWYADGEVTPQTRETLISLLETRLPLVATFPVDDGYMVRFYRERDSSFTEYRVVVLRHNTLLSDWDFQVAGFPVTQKTAIWWARKHISGAPVG